MYEVKWTAPGGDTKDAFFVRQAVFVEEQGFSLEIELDDTDTIAHHVVLYDRDQKPAACGRLFSDGDLRENTYHIGRVAVMKPWRGTGLGRGVMEEMEKKARELKAGRIVLGAQCSARGFYEGLGYTQFGEPFMDEHCPHVHMEKRL